MLNENTVQISYGSKEGGYVRTCITNSRRKAPKIFFFDIAQAKIVSTERSLVTLYHFEIDKTKLDVAVFLVFLKVVIVVKVPWIVSNTSQHLEVAHFVLVRPKQNSF